MDLFGTAGIRGDVRDDVTPSLALAVGHAAGADGDVFVLGRDGRETSPALASALTAGLESAGAEVWDVGELPTPALAYASRGRRGVMVTASHNPPEDNGIKLFVDGSEYGDDAETRIEERVASGPTPVDWDEWGDVRTVDPVDDYRHAVSTYASSHGDVPEELTVAVDCGNGMASLAAPHVISDLGADVRALNATVDGHFPGRESKPTPESLTDLRAFVADGPANVGFGFDGDADRVVVVDADGEVVHEDTVLALVAEHYVSASEAGDPVVVTTPNASARVDERVEAVGGRVERVRLGALHEGIASAREAGTDETRVVFAGEPWKHVHPTFGGWIDGITSAALLVRLLAARSLTERRDPVTERPYRKESVPCPDDRKERAMAILETTLPDAFPEASVDTEYGVRLDFPDGTWTLVRPSGTEPYVRVYAESEAIDDFVADVVTVVEEAVEG